jgi:hypothetical protein
MRDLTEAAMSAEILAQIEPLLERLSRDEKQRLVVQLASELRKSPGGERIEVAGM